MPKLPVLLLMVLSLALPSIVVARDDLAHLATLEGQYPSDGKPSFFEVPLVKQAFTRLVPAKLHKVIPQQLGVETPNQVLDGYLTVSGCKAHDCPSQSYLALANLQTGALWFFYYNAALGKSGNQATRCFADQPQVSALPSSVQRQVALLHDSNDDEQLLQRNPWVQQLSCGQ